MRHRLLRHTLHPLAYDSVSRIRRRRVIQQHRKYNNDLSPPSPQKTTIRLSLNTPAHSITALSHPGHNLSNKSVSNRTNRPISKLRIVSRKKRPGRILNRAISLSRTRNLTLAPRSNNTRRQIIRSHTRRTLTINSTPRRAALTQRSRHRKLSRRRNNSRRRLHRRRYRMQRTISPRLNFNRKTRASTNRRSSTARSSSKLSHRPTRIRTRDHPRRQSNRRRQSQRQQHKPRSNHRRASHSSSLHSTLRRQQ